MSSENSSQTNMLDGTSWSLAAIDQRSPLADTSITIDFGENSISGSSGCNEYSGTYQMDGDQITVDRSLSSTQQLCLDDSVMEQEMVYLQALLSAERIELSDNRLVMYHENGTLEFER